MRMTWGFWSMPVSLEHCVRAVQPLNRGEDGVGGVPGCDVRARVSWRFRRAARHQQESEVQNRLAAAPRHTTRVQSVVSRAHLMRTS